MKKYSLSEYKRNNNSATTFSPNVLSPKPFVLSVDTGPWIIESENLKRNIQQPTTFKSKQLVHNSVLPLRRSCLCVQIMCLLAKAYLGTAVCHFFPCMLDAAWWIFQRTVNFQMWWGGGGFCCESRPFNYPSHAQHPPVKCSRRCIMACTPVT